MKCHTLYMSFPVVLLRLTLILFFFALIAVLCLISWMLATQNHFQKLKYGIYSANYCQPCHTAILWCVCPSKATFSHSIT